jgi:glycosyltransferase involved in cell wall biosynthesis
MVGELVAYKKVELAVRTFNKLGKPLVVIGGGDLLDFIRSIARPNIRVLGHAAFDVLRSHYVRARALIFPGEEDFGIVPLEAMASGRPVIAFGRGGALETVVDGVTGLLFQEQTVDALAAAISQCEQMHWDGDAIAAHARSFGKDQFKTKMKAFVDEAMGIQEFT